MAPRRKLVWARRTVSGTVVADAAPSVEQPIRLDFLDLFEQSLGASTIGATVVRTRGVFAVGTAGANDAIINIRLTAYVGDNNDVQRGPNANDNSFDLLSQNRDFFIFEPFLVVGDAFFTDIAPSDPTSRMIDVKSSRKIEELNQTVVMDISAFSPDATTAQAVTFHGDLSMLLMLP